MHKMSSDYAKPGLMSQSAETTEDEHSWQLRCLCFCLLDTSSYLPVLFTKDRIQFA